MNNNKKFEYAKGIISWIKHSSVSNDTKSKLDTIYEGVKGDEVNKRYRQPKGQPKSIPKKQRQHWHKKKEKTHKTEN